MHGTYFFFHRENDDSSAAAAGAGGAPGGGGGAELMAAATAAAGSAAPVRGLRLSLLRQEAKGSKGGGVSAPSVTRPHACRSATEPCSASHRQPAPFWV